MVRAANGLEAGVKAFRNRQRIANWREDENGLLTVTVCVLKEGVYPYGADECEGLPDTLAGRGTVMEFIPAAEFTPEAMKTLEGKPATIMTDEEVPRVADAGQRHEGRFDGGGRGGDAVGRGGRIAL